MHHKVQYCFSFSYTWYMWFLNPQNVSMFIHAISELYNLSLPSWRFEKLFHASLSRCWVIFLLDTEFNVVISLKGYPGLNSLSNHDPKLKRRHCTGHYYSRKTLLIWSPWNAPLDYFRALLRIISHGRTHARTDILTPFYVSSSYMYVYRTSLQYRCTQNQFVD